MTEEEERAYCMKLANDVPLHDTHRQWAADMFMSARAEAFEAGRKSLDLCETKLRIETRNSAARLALLEGAEAKLARVEALLEVLTKLPQVPQCQESIGYGEYHEKVWASTLVRVRDEAAAVRAALADSGEKP